MPIYSPILLASLLVTGLANSFSAVEYPSQKRAQSDLVQQQLLAGQTKRMIDCSKNGQSPPPGCGRRDR